MQHPDEGMIHSWLDGALSAEEAARVESHVSDCASCRAVVAEARGFIAASSRILTALDDVPRGVLPAVPAKTRDFRIVWRAAAAMLVVAGGSFVVMREGGQDARIATEAVTAGAVDQVAPPAPTTPAPLTERAESIRDGRPVASADAATSGRAPAIPPVAAARRSESARQSDLSTGADLARPKASVGQAAGTTGAAAVANAPSALQMQMNEATPASDAAPLKVVRVERPPGFRRTTYQVAASETVTLTEPEADSTAAPIVLRGNTSAVMSGQRERRATGSAAPASAEAAKTSPPPPPPSTMMDSKAGAAFSVATNTITWIEPGTGKTLTLSGNVSAERLQEIRKRIEKERASAPRN